MNESMLLALVDFICRASVRSLIALLPSKFSVRILTFDITYRNDGPEVQPAGARVNLTLFYSGYWDSPSISSNPSNIPLTFVGRTEETGVTNLGEPALVLWIWTVGTPLAVGQTFP